MKNFKNYRILALLIFVILLACSIVPITGRRQLNLIPSSTMLSMSNGQYNQFLSENKLSRNTSQVSMVKNVGKNIQYAVEKYLRENGMKSELKNYDWEFNLVESSDVNAWCMPGGKVVVYTGILPYTKDETGLAVVIAHEIAHAVAKHGNERVSQGLIVQLGGMALSKALEEKPEKTRQIWMTAYGVGAQVGVLLPYSRTQEYEADHLGLIFMAMAGYDPNRAVDFWKDMAAKSGAKPPEFLSTHPSDANRIKSIQGLIPEAMKYYKK